ncbi:MAG: DUF3846 domain-containing protein [[Clostridium] innocuum]|nr:DUF3846 domain-containing protein [[Clostridium] innocuum]MBS5685858.1 DUF3846 domain-containing protein [[Clostridium] innocuum]
MIRILLIRPKEHPIVQEIENSLESLQNIVGGYIETVTLDEAVMIVNEEGKLLGLEGNRSYGADILVGNIVIAGVNEDGEFIPLNGEQIDQYSNMFYEVEDIKQEEIQHRFMCF